MNKEGTDLYKNIWNERRDLTIGTVKLKYFE